MTTVFEAVAPPYAVMADSAFTMICAICAFILQSCRLDSNTARDGFSAVLSVTLTSALFSTVIRGKSPWQISGQRLCDT